MIGPHFVYNIMCMLRMVQIISHAHTSALYYSTQQAIVRGSEKAASISRSRKSWVCPSFNIILQAFIDIVPCAWFTGSIALSSPNSKLSSLTMCRWSDSQQVSLELE